VAAEIQEATGIVVRTTPGGRGQFDVRVGDRIVFSKTSALRFPDPGEIARLLQPAT
jgi:hypothetical protein